MTDWLILKTYSPKLPACTVQVHQKWCSSLLYGTRLPPVPDFIIVWDCPWNREERNIVDKDPIVPGDLDKDKLNKGWSMAQYSINCSTCLYVGPLGLEKLDHQMMLLAVPEAVSSQNEGRSRSAVKSCPIKIKARRILSQVQARISDSSYFCFQHFWPKAYLSRY